jgi:hypothetical protein
VTDENKALKLQLAAAQAEIEMLKLNLSNVTLLLKHEMTASGKLPDPRTDKERFEQSSLRATNGQLPRFRKAT